ncbi:fasciclin domain-containing protein [Mycobacterium sp. NPDC048908]|uniref:fasciclin domain-containing protein n=1 Tax=Mycobacterium sp. NPDC048908 TaxID=3364292 RepID=UPI00371823BE
MTSWHFRLGATAVAVATMLAVSIGSAGAAPVADPIGPSCALYAPQGRANAGSAAAAAQQPVSVFLTSDPKLSALSAALSGKLNPAVNLLDILDAGEVTIFAPADSAFSRLPVEATAALRTDAASLTRLLNYHVIPGRFTPADIDGTHKTLQGSELSVTGPADRLWVNDALVLCGGIITANATLYLIDTVLTPPPGW